MRLDQSSSASLAVAGACWPDPDASATRTATSKVRRPASGAHLRIVHDVARFTQPSPGRLAHVS